jgi:tetratricopeptide (TPR) repeat protein
VTSQFTPYILIFTIPGAMALLREKRKVFWFLLLTICVNTFFGIGVYAKITELVDMEAYNLPTFICLSIFIGEGISCFLKTVKRIPNSFSLLLPLLPFFFNLYPSDYSRYYFAYDFGRNLLKDLPEKTVLFNRIDLDVFPLWYHQYVENFRRDVAVFPIHFIQRPWFIQNILKEHPWTDSKAVSGIMERMNRIRAEGKEIVGMYERTISAIIHTNCRKYPIYYTFFRPDERIDMPYLDRLHKDGLCYQVKIGLGEKALPKREHRFSYRGVFDRNVYKDVWAREILYIYSYYHADIGQHYLNRGEVDRAIVQLERSLKFDPENPSYMGALGAAYGVAKRYKDAVKILEKAVEADPENELFSQYLAMARANLRATSHQPH